MRVKLLIILGLLISAGFVTASIWTNPSSTSVHYGQTGGLIFALLVIAGMVAGFPE